MRFNPNYKTKDGWFEVMLDKSILENKSLEEGTYLEYWHNKDFTLKEVLLIGIKHLLANIILMT